MRFPLLVLALTLVTVSGGTVMAETHDDTENRNKAVVKSSFDAWRNGTGSPFDLLAEDAIWTIVGHSTVSGTYRSREAFLREVIEPFNARMRVGLRPTVRNIYADGDTVIIFFDAMGTTRNGNPYANTYAWFFDMRGGKVIKATAFYDSVEFNAFWAEVKPEPAR